MIKKSNDIFQILLKNYVKKNQYKDNWNKILNGDDDIIRYIEIKLNDNFVLTQSLLFFFEKNSLNYLINYYEVADKNQKKKDKDKDKENEPLKIFIDCIHTLYYYIFNPTKLDSYLKEICKLYCIGYIKTFSYIFIQKYNNNEYKSMNRLKIIDIINGNASELKLNSKYNSEQMNSICKMIRIYIYKIFYNDFPTDIFFNENMIEKYNLNKYSDFRDLTKNMKSYNIYKIDYEIKTLKYDYYHELYDLIKNYKENNFNNIKLKDFDIKQYGIDNFYIISYNLGLLNTQTENSYIINNEFYNTLLNPLFKEDSLLIKAIELFYDSTKYDTIKKFSKNIKCLLFGYRYCLNELAAKNKKGIYYPLYTRNNIDLAKEKFFPGNDTKPNPLYFDIINHFNMKPKEGCYVCLCQDGYYHFALSGFPGENHLDKKCPKCHEPIGTIKSGKNIVIVKREGYFRILKDENEIEEIKKDINKKCKMDEINYMTLEQYKKNYIYKANQDKKGIFIPSDINYFKNDNKIVRNLSQISFRLLNYILYTHLFFARLITDKREFSSYCPGEMDWTETLNECWNILKNELLKKEIYSIEKFMSYIFIYLFPILNEKKMINDYESLIEIEDNLESTIQKLINNFKEQNDRYNIINRRNDEDKTSFISLLQEKYTRIEYSIEQFPFYEYFYYTNYLNEKYISEKLEHMYQNKYPVLKTYLDNKNKNNSNNNENSLENLNLFNSALNVINEKYTNKLSREMAQKSILCEQKIYIDNKNLIDNFIELFNSNLNNKELKLELSNKNPLADFLMDDNNKYGKAYKSIYMNFITKQNEKLEILLDIKIDKGIFDEKCKDKIYIQQITEKEIFTLNLPKKVSFLDILFNSSYRKILDNKTRSYESYKEFEINYDLIEEKLTDLLLRNKKLLNNELIEFIYNNEVFDNQVLDFITKFKTRFNN